MRFPSLKLLYTEARATFFRFPFVVITAFVAAAAGIRAVDNTEHHDAFLNLLLTGQLGIPLLFAMALYSGRKGWSKTRTVLLQVLGIAALADYYARLPEWLTPVAFIRFVQLNAALHLLVAFVPYVRSNELLGFWQYNKSIFLRFLVAALYSAVLYAGLSIALFAVDTLLGLEIDEDTYAKLWLVVAFVFNTWFFLGGVPLDFAALGRSSDYPRGLKIFTQYILVPIVIIYLTILTIYLVKIIVTTAWPSGMIGYLVSAVAAAGIFSILLVYPVKDSEENRWVRTYSKWFYLWLFPAIVMLSLAIGKRIAQYGVTEKRYVLVVLTAWLAGIAVYFTVSRKKNIKLIPASLCLVAFATSFGPWGAYDVSERSQARRLESYLSANGILADGRIHPATGSISFDQRKEISAILSYLVRNHGTHSLEPWFGGALAEIDTTAAGPGPSRPGEAEARVRLILGHIGVQYVAGWAGDTDRFRYRAESTGHPYEIAGYDVLCKLSRDWRTAQTVEAGGVQLDIRYDMAGAAVRISRQDDVLVEVAIDGLFDNLRVYGEAHSELNAIPPDLMRVGAENDRIKVMIHFGQISGRESDEGIDIQYVDADLLLRIK